MDDDLMMIVSAASFSARDFRIIATPEGPGVHSSVIFHVSLVLSYGVSLALWRRVSLHPLVSQSIWLCGLGSRLDDSLICLRVLHCLSNLQSICHA